MTSTVAELTSALVKIESINPGPAGSDVSGARETNVSRYVRDWLTARGVPAERREYEPGRHNVIAVVEGSGPRRLLFDAHTDTVPVEGMEIEPLSGEIRDGKVFGRGACDDKGTLAAGMWALAELVAEGVTPPATIELLASADEEGRFGGIRDWVATSGADAAIIGEASEMKLITASRGAVRFKVHTRGTAVHTCSPELGVNAVVGMARVLTAIEDELKPRVLAHKHPLLDAPRISATLIEGGRRANIVPDECVIDIDRRLLPDETAESALAQFDEAMTELAARYPEVIVDRPEPYGYVPAAECPADNPLVIAAQAALGAEGLSTEINGVPYTTHASVTAEAGIPSITIGPGSIEQAHAPVEWVPVDQLEAAARVYRRIFETYGASDGPA